MSLRFAILVTFLACTIDAASVVKISNGTDAEEGEFKFAVSVRTFLLHDCGATIINEKFVLTAAHCVCDSNRPMLPPSLLSIQYGSIHLTPTEERSIPISNISCSNFDIFAAINDVAVLELEFPLPSDDDSWEPVNLSRDFDTAVEQKGTVIGWGMLWNDGPYATTLQKLDVEIYSDETCGTLYKPEHHICFGADPVGGACSGDSGSPLIAASGEQVGVGSFISAPCGISSPGLPNVYARVSRYIDWIEEQSKL